jgi:cobalamin synthase
MKNIISFLEKMWLMVAIVCLVLAVYKAIFSGFEDSMFFVMFTVLATALWLLRRRMRRRMEGYPQESKE